MASVAYRNDQLLMIAKENFDQLATVCSKLEMSGYWRQPQSILKQSSVENLDLYVQCILFQMAVTCKRLRENERWFIMNITGKNLLGMTRKEEQDKQAYEIAARMHKLPPVLLQLCGVYDREHHSHKSEIFIDALLNILLCLSSVDTNRGEAEKKFIENFGQQIKMFINQEPGEEEMVSRFVTYKLQSERIGCHVGWLLDYRERAKKRYMRSIQAAIIREKEKVADSKMPSPVEEVKKPEVVTEESQTEHVVVTSEGNSGAALQEKPDSKEQLRQMFAQRQKEFLEETKRREQEEEAAAKEQMQLMKERIKERERQMEMERQARLDCVLEEMNSLVGLAGVKEEVQSLINLIKVAKMREKHNMPAMEMSYHMVFAGSPGTGKTTVARLVARIYKELGILSKGQLVETDRAGLVAGYVGQTALKVTEVVEQAIGGVLFIDEAYALTNQSVQNDFGGEALDTLVKLMEDHRDDLVVIVAGYTEEMKDFLKSNTGLISRFNKFIDFPDYTLDELVEILDCMAFRSGMLLEPEAKEKVRSTLAKMDEEKRQRFGNARGIRNTFETIVTNQANRIVQYEDPTIEQLKMITVADVG